jgi:hypothetical protein
MGEEEQVPGAARCRRWDCDDVPVARGLCTTHWARWHNGVDELDLPQDDAPAPPAQVWWPPKRSGSLSDAARVIMHKERAPWPSPGE